MIANHIHDALGQVRRLQELVLARRHFRGYSGKARLFCAMAVLIGTLVMSSSKFPVTPQAHLVGWGIVMMVALFASYAALALWFLFDPQSGRNLRALKPAVDAVPALAVGAILSVALIVRHNYDLLPAVWMMLYGLAQTAYRQSLPIGIWFVGLGYIACGVIYLTIPQVSVTTPFPMGIVFFTGELIGGWIMLSSHEQIIQQEN